MAPWNKDPGPIAKGTKECELLKKKVDALVKESNKVIGNKKLKDKETKLEQLYQNCLDYRKLVQDQNQSIENLKEEDEPAKVKNYDQKKTQELNKLSAMKVLLNETLSKLLPDTTEEEFIKKNKKDDDKEDNEEKEKDEKQEEKDEKATAKPTHDEDEDEDDDDDEDEEDDDEEEEDDDDEDEEEEDEEEEEKPSVKQTKIPSGAASKHDDGEEEEDDDEEDDEEETEEEDEEDEDEDDDEDDEEEEDDRPVPAKRGAESKTKKTKEEDDDEEKDEDEEEDEDDDDEDEEDEEEKEDEKKKKGKKSDEKSKKVEKSAKKKKGEDKKGDDAMEVTQQTLHKFEAIDDYDAEEEGDLMFTKGTILTVLETRDDGWWVAENEAGEKGLVPSTYLQKYNPYEGVQQQDDDDDDEPDEDEDDDEATPRASQRSKKLWGSLKKAVTDTTVSDVLHAMGAVPPGFRKSTLSRKFNESEQYRLANYMTPKLSPSNLMYSDLFFEPSTSKIRLRSTRNERVITIVSCQQIPPPGAGVEVEGRHVRMCLFDGQQILSNIHSVTVSSVDKSQRSWAFSTRLADNIDPYSHAEVFFRTNNTTSNIGILFELCISYSRVSTSEKGEFSCGWVHLPIFDINGIATANKSYDLYVNGGTPYEKGVEVDPAISRRTSSSALASLISGNKQPRLVIKLNQPKQQHKELMDTLPDTMMGSTTLLPLYSYYRCCLADTLLRDRLDLDSTELIHSPLLKQLPKIADTPDLMKIFRTSWLEKLKDVRRAEKSSFLFGLNPLRDEEYMKEMFRQVFMDSVYPIHHVATLPAYRMGDEDNDKVRQENILRYNETKRGNKSALATLLSPNLVFHPMLLDEVAYSVIGPNCLSKAQSVS